MVDKAIVDRSAFNQEVMFPYQLRVSDFDVAMQDEVDNETEPAAERRPMRFIEVYIGEVQETDFRSNARTGNLGTRTATLHKDGIAKLRRNWVCKLTSTKTEASALAKAERKAASAKKAKAKTRT